MNPFYSIQKLFESFLGFKDKRTIVLSQRNSLLRLLILINIPTIILLYFFNTTARQPYMDEEFHYRQFSKYYFEGKFTDWGPKITTPPGLYYVLYGFAWLLSNITSMQTAGSLAAVRSINALVFGNLAVIFCMKIYEQKDYNINNLSRALNLILTPTIFFFNFLNYTDTLSLCLVIMTFYYTLVKSEWRLAIVSLLAMYTRQNNLIWVVYMMVYRIFSEYKKQMFSPKPFISHVFTIIRVAFGYKFQILKQLRLQILSIAVFFAYLKYYNDGHLTFGDHSNHKLTAHPTQLLYLALFMTLNLPVSLNDYFTTVKSTIQKLTYSRHFLAAYLLLLSISIIIVDKYTIVHQFILADNRHFSFYVYRLLSYEVNAANEDSKLLLYGLIFIKWVICAIYPLCIMFLFRIVVNSDEKLFKFLLWIAACFGYVGMTELVELRYFTIPFVLYSLEIENKNISIDIEKMHKNVAEESNENKTHRMIWTTLFKILINAVAIGLFLGWEFDNQWGKGRVMW